MTTWTYKVGLADQDILDTQKLLSPTIKKCIVGIELTRSGISFLYDRAGDPDDHIWLTDENSLQLLFFAQQLVSLISETHPEWVKKNHIAVSAKAVEEYTNVP